MKFQFAKTSIVVIRINVMSQVQKIPFLYNGKYRQYPNLSITNSSNIIQVLKNVSTMAILAINGSCLNFI